MRQLIILIASLVLVVTAYPVIIQAGVGAASLPEIEWIRTYGGDFIDAGVRVISIQTPDSGYAFLGRTHSFAVGDDDYYLLRLNRYGDTLWSKTYGGPEGVAPQDIIITYDGGFMICGSNSNYGYDSTFFALKTDSLGEPRWIASAGYRGCPYAVVQSPDSGFVFVGFTRDAGHPNNPLGFVVKLSKNGDSLWAQSFGFTLSESGAFNDIISLSDGAYLTCGYYYNYDSLRGDIILVKINDAGSVLWTQHIGTGNIGSGMTHRASSLALITDTTAVMVGGKDGDASFWIIDTAGMVLDTFQFSDTTGQYAIDVAATVDRGFILCAMSETSTPSPVDQSLIIKYDSSYNEQWIITVDSNYNEHRPRSIQQTYDGGYIFAGSVSSIDPHDNDIDMYALKIATEIPYVSFFQTENANPHTHVANHTPLFEWSAIDPNGIGQEAYEMEVGVDRDWSVAEMWSAGVVTASDTSTAYSGLPLTDGETYYVRVRVSNGLDWSPWYETFFRMNSLPSVPVLLHPSGGEVTGRFPTLWIENSVDAEGDTLTYDFLGYHDTDCMDGGPIDMIGVPEESDSTGAEIDSTLAENCIHWWRARAFDGYEYSEWSEFGIFLVDGVAEPPTVPQANYPPDTSGMPVYDMLPTFIWSQSYDPDPLDTVRYKLEISIDSNFTFVFTIDSLPSTSHTLTDSLGFNTHYWWRVIAFDKTGLSSPSWNQPDFWSWTLGDVDHSHVTDISDLTRLVDYLFITYTPIYPLKVGDVNGDCLVDIGDLTRMIAYLFLTFTPLEVGCE